MTLDPLGAAYLVAIAAEAMTAALAAGRRRLDWFGVAVLGCVTALGGGTVRDEANRKVMQDPRMKPEGDMPFDGKRMIFGGFELLLDTDEE